MFGSQSALDRFDDPHAHCHDRRSLSFGQLRDVRPVRFINNDGMARNARIRVQYHRENVVFKDESFIVSEQPSQLSAFDVVAGRASALVPQRSDPSSQFKALLLPIRALHSDQFQPSCSNSPCPVCISQIPWAAGFVVSLGYPHQQRVCRGPLARLCQKAGGLARSVQHVVM